MRRLISLVLVAIIATSLLLPILPAVGRNEQYLIDGTRAPTGTSRAPFIQSGGITFPEPLNTSRDVPEYPLISRALMLQSGASDIKLADMNGDNRTDLIVAQYEAKAISVFYRNGDGSFSTYASLNITTRNAPFKIVLLDAFADGTHQVAALERDSVFSGTRLALYNMTSETTYENWPDTGTYANAASIVAGNLSNDEYPDIALVCAGPDSSSVRGRIEVFFGPYYSWSEVILAGYGANSIVAGDFNDDSLDELAVSNYNSSNVMLFDQPFSLGDTPYQTLNVTGHPAGITMGLLDGNSLDDIAVITDGPSAVRFFFQDPSGLQDSENENRSLGISPSFIVAGNFSGGRGDDLLILSAEDNASLGFVQLGSGPIWSDTPDFTFPTNALPRTAVVGELNGDSLPDISIASAGSDWAGSSIAIYPNRYPEHPIFCNGNTTAWTNRSASPSVIATGDLDGNGIVDLVTLNVQNGTFDYILNFTGSIRTVNLWYTPGDLVVYDFNNDNCSEVVITDAGSSLMIVFYWRNSTSPSIVANLSANGNILDLAMGDFNNDGLEDILVSTDDGRLDFFFNDGSTVPFQTPYEYAPTPGSGIWSLTVGDFNNDMLDDIAYTKSIRKIIVVLQSPSLSFGPTSETRTLSYNQGADFTSIWAGDVTGDHKTDLVAMRPSDPSLYLFDQNDFVVSPYPFGRLVLPEVPRFVSVVDFTDDGHADVAAMFGSSDLLFLYRQNGSSLPESPSMVFVTGAGANYVTVGDGTGDRRGDLLTNDVGSHSISVWEQINFPPVAYAGGPYYTRQGDELQFNSSAETGTSERLYTSFRWDFGDGTGAIGMMLSRPKHVYTDVRPYNVSLEVTDPAGLTSINNTTVNVLDSYPHVGFTWSPLEPNEGQTVFFLSTTTSFDPVVSALWYVDGIVTGNGSSLALEFQDGTHDITLEVTDSDGSIAWSNRSIVVNSMLPELAIDASSSANEGEVVAVRAIVDQWHLSPIDPIVSYEWDFLYFPGFFLPDPNAPNSENASVVYSTSGYPQIFTIAVRVTDADGEVNITTWNIRIYDVGPDVNFTLSTLDPQEGQPLSFASTTRSFDGVVNWTWSLLYPGGNSALFYLDGESMSEHVFDSLADGNYTMTLTVLEADGNASAKSLEFHVREMPPVVQMRFLDAIWFGGHMEEFLPGTFFANVTSFDPVTSYEWDFDARGAEFIPDQTTSANMTSYAYVDVGNYTAKVRVTDSNNSSTISMVYVAVWNKPFGGGFYYGDIRVIRGNPDSNIVTFDPSRFVQFYPDLISGLWDYGDGETLRIDGPPSESVVHTYAEGHDYTVSLTVEDDDHAVYTTQSVIYVTPPTISLVEPLDGSAVKPGTPIIFMIEPGSSELLPVSYSINGSQPRLFESMYTLDTTGWADAKYTIGVAAWDISGNMASKTNMTISIDSEKPLVFLSTDKATAFGGGKVNITIRVVDRNVVADGITLYVRFPGESAYSAFTASGSDDGGFYRVLDVPLREGVMDIYANVTDRAGNSVVTSVYEFSVNLHFIYRAWPYLLLMSVLVAVGVSGYYVRESGIAIDETFVIYNDGRMISHSTRRLKPGMDDEVMSGMLVAIQDFVKESFKDITSFTLRKLEFGDKSVVIEKGDHFFLAVILHGHASKKAVVKMQRVVSEIERDFGTHLKDWDGDLEKMRGISDIVKKLYSKAPVIPALPKENT